MSDKSPSSAFADSHGENEAAPLVTQPVASGYEVRSLSPIEAAVIAARAGGQFPESYMRRGWSAHRWVVCALGMAYRLGQLHAQGRQE